MSGGSSEALGVCYRLYYSWLDTTVKIGVRRLQEAKMGLKVIFSDIYININSDIHIVLVQILACSNVCRGS